MTEFYYDRKKLGLIAFFSLIVLWFALHFFATTLIETMFLWLIKLISLIAAFSAWYVFLKPQPLAKISREGIVIDKNSLLKWEDIQAAQKIKVGILRRPIIRFELKKGVEYNLRPMQKINRSSCYGAFSVPLYAMKEKDADKIEKEIKGYISLSK